MSDERKKFKSTYENIRSGLLELEFPGADEKIVEDSGKFITGIQDRDFGMFIEITFQADIVDIKVSPDFLFEVPDMVPFYQLINEINLKLMDIGHFALNEAEEDLVLQASIDLSDDNFDREQMLTTIKRITIQGLQLFKLMKEMFDGDQCPFHLLHNYIEEVRDTQVFDQKTIH